MKINPDLIEVREIRTSDSVVTHELVYAGVSLGPASALASLFSDDPAALEEILAVEIEEMSGHERLAFKAKIRAHV